MKHTAIFFSAITVLLLALTGCDKKDSIPVYTAGSAPVLTGSATAVAAKPGDSLTNVISFSWTDPKYPIDSGAAPVKYTLQIDSTGRNFSKAISFVLMGQLS